MFSEELFTKGSSTPFSIQFEKQQVKQCVQPFMCFSLMAFKVTILQLFEQRD